MCSLKQKEKPSLPNTSRLRILAFTCLSLSTTPDFNSSPQPGVASNTKHGEKVSETIYPPPSGSPRMLITVLNIRLSDSRSKVGGTARSWFWWFLLQLFIVAQLLAASYFSRTICPFLLHNYFHFFSSTAWHTRYGSKVGNIFNSNFPTLFFLRTFWKTPKLSSLSKRLERKKTEGGANFASSIFRPHRLSTTKTKFDETTRRWTCFLRWDCNELVRWFPSTRH